MEVTSYSAYTEDSTLQLPVGVLMPRFMQSLDRLIDYLGEHTPDELPRVLPLIERLTRGETSCDLPDRDDAIADTLLARCAHGNEYRGLFWLSMICFETFWEWIRRVC